MSYTVRRVSLRSALRLGLLLGWLVALIPAAAAAGLCVLAVQQVSGALGQVNPYELEVFGQTVVSLDPLVLLGLADTAQNLNTLAAGGWGLFATMTVGLTLAGGLGVALTILLVCWCYNLIAAVGGGLQVELGEA